MRAIMRGRPLRSRRVIVYVGSAEGPPGTAFVTSRRIGGSVRRNRARRIMRDAWASLAPRLREPSDVVLVARAEIAGATTGELIEEVEEVLARAGVIS